MTDVLSCNLSKALGLTPEQTEQVGTITYVTEGKTVTTGLFKFELDHVLEFRAEVAAKQQSAKARATSNLELAELLGEFARGFEPLA